MGRPVSGTGRSRLAFALAAAPGRPASDRQAACSERLRPALAVRAADLAADLQAIPPWLPGAGGRSAAFLR